MPALASAIPTDRPIILHLVGGHVLVGHGQPLEGGWLRLRSRDCERLVNLVHVVLIDASDGVSEESSPIDAALPRPKSKDTPIKLGSRAPGRAWTDPDLKALSEGFLDHVNDSDLAQRHHRTKGQIRDLKQAFECQRGNLVEDEISPAARLWVDRWRRVLRKG